MVDNQIHNINTMQDDIEFAQVLKTSNQVLSDLKDQNSLETLEETMELLQSTEMQQSRIKELMQELGGANSFDEDIMNEYEFLDVQSQIESLNNQNELNPNNEEKAPALQLN